MTTVMNDPCYVFPHVGVNSYNWWLQKDNLFKFFPILLLLFTILYAEVKFWVSYYVKEIKLTQIQYSIFKSPVTLVEGNIQRGWLEEREKSTLGLYFSYTQLWLLPQNL